MKVGLNPQNSSVCISKSKTRWKKKKKEEELINQRCQNKAASSKLESD